MDSAVGTGARSDLVGQVLAGRYRVVERIGAGGMATIFRGYDESLERDVAVKVLHAHLADDPALLGRFRTEARHAAGLLHPNIVNVFDQGVADLPFIVMEHVDGPSLRTVLLARGLLSPGEVLSVVEPVCAALERAHVAGVVHRDIKPENVLIAPDGTPKIADFGIARAVAETSLTQTGILIGSVHYLAPELVDGSEATPASDQYAVGVLLFELLTGRKPLTADSPMAVAVRHTRERIPPPSRHVRDLPRALDRVVARATHPQPDRRHPDVAALGAALRAAVPGGAAPLVVPREPGSDTIVLPAEAQETMSVEAAADVASRGSRRRRWTGRRRRGEERRSGSRGALVAIAATLLAAAVLAGGGWLSWNFLLAPVTTVPELVGEDEATARAAAEELGLDLEVAGRSNDLDAPAGEILSQEPASGAPLRRGGVIAVVASDGPSEVTVPRVTGSTEEGAQELLSTAPYHFEVAVEQAHDDAVAAGLVISQDPEPGSEVLQRAPVQLVVSLGIEQVSVPDLSGLSRDEAAAELRAAGLDVSFAEEFSDEVPEAGQVVDQSVAADAQVDRGSTVGVTVSLGPATVEVPDVRQAPIDEARATLEASGMAVAVEEQARPRIGPFRRGEFGLVEEQVPEPGRQARRGETVTIYTFSEAAEG